MTGRRPFADLTAAFTPERKARVASRVAELKTQMALAELRQARARSQQELALLLKVKQPAVAKLEKRTDMYVSNLRRYIEALGGTLEITATFPDGRVAITNFSDLDTAIEEDEADHQAATAGRAVAGPRKQHSLSGMAEDGSAYVGTESPPRKKTRKS